MKIEFKKVPFTEKEFSASFTSVKLEGTFCKISPLLVKVDANLTGETDIDCSRCGDTMPISVDEKLNFLLSDGIFKDDQKEDLVIEVENNTIDFDEIINSELASIKSDYYCCDNCQDSGNIEKEF